MLCFGIISIEEKVFPIILNRIQQKKLFLLLLSRWHMTVKQSCRKKNNQFSPILLLLLQMLIYNGKTISLCLYLFIYIPLFRFNQKPFRSCLIFFYRAIFCFSIFFLFYISLTLIVISSKIFSRFLFFFCITLIADFLFSTNILFSFQYKNEICSLSNQMNMYSN